MNNKKQFILCLIGGIMLIAAEVTGSIGAFALLAYIAEVPELEFLVPLVNYLIWGLIIIAGLGGFGVIAGGFLLTTPRFGTGKFIIGLAAGMTFVGLIIQLGKIIYFGGFEGLWNFIEMISQSIKWIGIIIVIMGRRTAKAPE